RQEPITKSSSRPQQNRFLHLPLGLDEKVAPVTLTVSTPTSGSPTIDQDRYFFWFSITANPPGSGGPHFGSKLVSRVESRSPNRKDQGASCTSGAHRISHLARPQQARQQDT